MLEELDDELVPGPLLEVDVAGSLEALGAESPSVDGEGSSDAVDPSSPLTCGTTTSDDNEDPDGPSLAELVALEALTEVVVDVGVLVRCNAARTDEGDSGAGR